MSIWHDNQDKLAELGFNPGPVDGKPGAMTGEAVAAALWSLELLRAQLAGESGINAAGLALVKEFEGFRADAYRDPVGIWTIGYGTTARAGVGVDPQPGMRIIEREAEGYLLKALAKFAATIRPWLVGKPTPNQWAAMLSLAYNIGPDAFRRSSVLRHFNAGDMPAAAEAFLLWNRAGGAILPGLVRRREAERQLFLQPPKD
jgi:lysozyme